MRKLNTKILILNIFITIVVILFGYSNAFAYFVSGSVDLEFRDFETKVGDVRTSEQDWTESFRANIEHYIIDPRVMRFGAGVGISRVQSNVAADSQTLSYDFHTYLFPTMKYNADFYASKNKTTNQSSTSLSGYDTQTTSYGGSLNLNLSRQSYNGNNRNNNNNYNNNNNNNNNNNDDGNNNGHSNRRFSWSFPLPDISLSYRHTETESISSTTPLHQTLDVTSVSTGNFVPRPNVSLDLNGSLEKFNDLDADSSYDTKSAGFHSAIAVSPNADLKLVGNLSDRSTQNLTGYDNHYETTSLSANLDFHEKNKLRHYYSYSMNNQNGSTSTSSSQNGAAGVMYRLSPEIMINGGLQYSLADYVSKATTSTAEQNSQLDSFSATGGASYNKKYSPDWLGPFQFSTSYAFNYGESSYKTNATGQESGSGLFYTNSANVGLVSEGWKLDKLSLAAGYSNRRDHSPLHNNTESQQASASFTTVRIPRTTINASLIYQEQTSTATIASPLIANTNSSTLGHSLLYSLTADHNLNRYMTLSAGATRQEQKSTTLTLSTLEPSPTASKVYDDVVYASAALSYPITRMLLYHAVVRDEFRDSTGSHGETRSLDMSLNYRIRKITIDMTAKLREDISSTAATSEQQLYYVKISRPF